jgi:uncharacterized membrane protein
MNTIWLIFIILHTLSGIICFISGLMLLSPKRYLKNPSLLWVFLLSLLGLIMFLVGAIISHWYELDVMTKTIYIGLFFLSLYMMYRALKARRRLLANEKSFEYVEDIGFPLIALFNGFVIVALIDLGAPAWVVAGGAIAAAIIGGRLVTKKKNKLENTTKLN